MDTRVFWSVLCALLVFCGLIVSALSMVWSAERRAAQQIRDQTIQNVQQLSEKAHRDAQVYRQQQVALQQAQLDRRRLASNQRCVGGVVIQVQGNAYTQLGTIAEPIHCAGDFADQPLR